MSLIVYLTIGLLVSLGVYHKFPGPNDSFSGRVGIMFLWPFAVVFIVGCYVSLYAFVFSGRHTDKTGKTFKLRDMTNDHLRNAIKYGRALAGSPYWDLQVPRMEKELERRK